MKRGIYAILDAKARDLTGAQVYVYPHEAVAVRFFHDVASGQHSPIARHPEDYALVRLGYITETDRDLEDNSFELLELEPDFQLILEGKTWYAQLEAAAAAKEKGNA